MGVEGAVVVDDVAVIVRVAHADSAVFIDLDVVVAVADVEFLDTALGFDGPAQGTVLFLGVYDLYNFRDKVVVVEAVLDNLAGVAVELGESFDDCELNAFLVEKGDIGVKTADREESSRLESVCYGTVREGDVDEVVFVLCNLII